MVTTAMMMMMMMMPSLLSLLSSLSLLVLLSMTVAVAAGVLLSVLRLSLLVWPGTPTPSSLP